MKTAHPTWHLNRSGRGLRPTEIGDAFYLYADSWLTFRQGLSLGGHVRRGECGITVVYADRFVPNAARRRNRRGSTSSVPQTLSLDDICFKAAHRSYSIDTQTASSSPIAEIVIVNNSMNIEVF